MNPYLKSKIRRYINRRAGQRGETARLLGLIGLKPSTIRNIMASLFQS